MIRADTQKYLDSLSNHGINPGIERMRQLMGFLGNPEAKFKSVHVTGTNGKGSVCAMIESVLRQARYKTGLYTSPHLVDIRERIQVSGRMIPRAAFLRTIEEIRKKLRVLRLEREITYFEMTTAAAFLYFAQQRIDIAVVEVGLGGRWDATNVLPSPELCVITNVTLDHMEYLGDTIAEIAKEKAGVLKAGSVCLTGASGPALRIIREVSKSLGVSCVLNGRNPVSKNLWDPIVKFFPLEGEYQKINLKIALSAVNILRAKNWRIADSHILNGLKKVSWPARFDLRMLEKIPALLDGAHNAAAIQTLLSSLKRKSLNKVPCLLVFNALKDKNPQPMILRLKNNLKIVRVLCPLLPTPRSSTPQSIRKAFGGSVPFEIHDSIKSLCGGLASVTPKNDYSWILVTGSLYLAGGILGQLKNRLRKSSFAEAFS